MQTTFLQALSDNIKIDLDKCTFCATCVQTCILDNIRMKLAPCSNACPLNGNCQGYIQLILRGKDEEALKMVKRDIPFPAILGRICSAPCENVCHMKKKSGEAVAIRQLKRYLTDKLGDKDIPNLDEATGKKCAVLGTGPSAMTAAFDLLKKGHSVTAFEKESEAGGMLRWGIPAFRLPLDILKKEFIKLKKMGLKLKLNKVIGKDISLADLQRNFDVIIVCAGLQKSKSLNIPGVKAENVYSALDFLKSVRSDSPLTLGEKVVVVGGGDVALDSAQTALRAGAKVVDIIALESRGEIPANPHLLAIAESEGVNLINSWGPSRFLIENGRANKLKFKRCDSVFDEQGNFSPIYDDSQIKELEADNVIIAIGQTADHELLNGSFEFDKLTLQTSQENIFIAGDLTGMGNTVVEAMASGREAAESVHRYLINDPLSYGRSYQGLNDTEFDIDHDKSSKEKRIIVGVSKFKGKGDFTEIEQSIVGNAEAKNEASRCNSCGSPFGKYRSCWFCLPCEVECPNDALYVEIPYLLR